MTNPFPKGRVRCRMCLLLPHSGAYPPDCGCPRDRANDPVGFLIISLYLQRHDNTTSFGLVLLCKCHYTHSMSERRGNMIEGSPKKGGYLQLRLSDDEKEAFAYAADLAGLSLSAWVRERLRRVAKDELETFGKPVAFLADRSPTTDNAG
jgi:hypothetical protein